jgi:hypothetical protein
MGGGPAVHLLRARTDTLGRQLRHIIRFAQRVPRHLPAFLKATHLEKVAIDGRLQSLQGKRHRG